MESKNEFDLEYASAKETKIDKNEWRAELEKVAGRLNAELSTYKERPIEEFWAQTDSMLKKAIKELGWNGSLKGKLDESCDIDVRYVCFETPGTLDNVTLLFDGIAEEFQVGDALEIINGQMEKSRQVMEKEPETLRKYLSRYATRFFAENTERGSLDDLSARNLKRSFKGCIAPLKSEYYAAFRTVVSEMTKEIAGIAPETKTVTEVTPETVPVLPEKDYYANFEVDEEAAEVIAGVRERMGENPMFLTARKGDPHRGPVIAISKSYVIQQPVQGLGLVHNLSDIPELPLLMAEHGIGDTHEILIERPLGEGKKPRIDLFPPRLKGAAWFFEDKTDLEDAPGKTGSSASERERERELPVYAKREVSFQLKDSSAIVTGKLVNMDRESITLLVEGKELSFKKNMGEIQMLLSPKKEKKQEENELERKGGIEHKNTPGEHRDMSPEH
jgi:hypothetical protein